MLHKHPTTGLHPPPKTSLIFVFNLRMYVSGVCMLVCMCVCMFVGTCHLSSLLPSCLGGKVNGPLAEAVLQESLH